MDLYAARKKAVGNATTFIVIDEPDRLRMTSLDRCAISSMKVPSGCLDRKRMARYPQFYSPDRFVHEFRPLATTRCVIPGKPLDATECQLARKSVSVPMRSLRLSR